jgi:hypothetical protein
MGGFDIMSYWVIATDQQANDMIQNGLLVLTGNNPPSIFQKYTRFIEDSNTGNKYWKIKTVKYNGIIYDVEQFVRDNYSLTEYSNDYVFQFVA